MWQDVANRYFCSYCSCWALPFCVRPTPRHKCFCGVLGWLHAPRAYVFIVSAHQGVLTPPRCCGSYPFQVLIRQVAANVVPLRAGLCSLRLAPLNPITFINQPHAPLGGKGG